MNTDRLLRLIETDEHSVHMQKMAMKGFVLRASEKEKLNQEDRNLIKELENDKNISDVILSTNDVKIYTVYGKKEWEIKYPYRFIYLDSKNNWSRGCIVSPSLDTCFLAYLEKKYLGLNSQFTEFALKMLEIKIEE